MSRGAGATLSVGATTSSPAGGTGGRRGSVCRRPCSVSPPRPVACRVPAPEHAAAPAKADVRELLGGLRFEANRGQVDERIDFIARGAGYEVSLSAGRVDRAGAGGARAVVGMSVLGAHPGARAAGVGDVVGRSNYLIGSDRSGWHRNVPSFERVRYAGVYPGIDMVYRGSAERLEYDFVVAPGADPDDIALAFTGGAVSLAGNGDLLVRAPWRDACARRPVRLPARRRCEARGAEPLRARIPRPRQLRAGPLRPLAAARDRPAARLLDLIGGGSQGEGLGGSGRSPARAWTWTPPATPTWWARRTRSRPPRIPPGGLPEHAGRSRIEHRRGRHEGQPVRQRHRVLDLPRRRRRGPRLQHGSGRRGRGVRERPDGLGGATPFPTKNAIQAARAPARTNDAFVAKLNAAGNDLVYSTYLGGSGERSRRSASRSTRRATRT